jgi:hypothetical protein
MEFETPQSRAPRLILFVLFVAWIGCICTANAQTSEPPQRETEDVTETSKCQSALQIFKGLQLVQLQIDPESLGAMAIYYRKLADGKIILFRLLREGCETPWRDGGVKVIPAPACVPTDTTSCL